MFHLSSDLPLHDWRDLGQQAVEEISSELTTLLADLFALYFKTKNFHWHMSGANFRDHHMMLDEQSEQILSATDLIAERARKVGGTTLRSIGHVRKIQRLRDNDAESVAPRNMLIELAADNHLLAGYLRDAHTICGRHRDVATASLIEGWIDEAEHRRWFLVESTRAVL